MENQLKNTCSVFEIKQSITAAICEMLLIDEEFPVFSNASWAVVVNIHRQ